MPMLDCYIPEGALPAEAEQKLLSQLTDILLKHEGADPANPQARAIAWVFLHRPAAVYVAGEKSQAPHYKIIASVPEGQFDDERRSAMVAAVTNAVLDAEEGARPRNPMRVWVFANEVPDGTWGGAGRIFRLKDVAAFVTGNAEKARQYAESRLGSRRKTATA